MGIKFRYVEDYFARHKARSFFRWIFDIAVVIFLGALIAIFFCQNVKMTESSMEPTLNTGDVLLVDNLVYRFRDPQRNDLIAFSVGEDNGNMYIKRIVGMPGETIQIADGLILINGVTYMEVNDFEQISYAGLAEKEITLGENEYFVLGDNRNNSSDSRYADIANVKKSDIQGKVWFRISPYSDIGFVK